MTVALLPFVKRLKIVTKDLRVYELGDVMNAAQYRIVYEVEKALAEQRRCRLIVLKARQVGACLLPSTRVLTADMKWVAIDSVKLGDELVAADEFPPGGTGAARKMRVAEVEGTHAVYEPALRLTMSNGQVLVATAEHRFLAQVRGGVNTQWREVGKMRVGDRIRYVTEPWGDPDYEDGWMGGLLDGEGSLRGKNRAGVELTITQVAGPVLERARSYLEGRGYSYRESIDDRDPGTTSKLGAKPVHRFMLGRMDELFHILGQTQPSRFARRDHWVGKELPGKRTGLGWSDVVSIEALPVQRMVDLQTSTGTYIAEGFVSHNSTVTEALMFTMAMILNNMSGLVISHEGDSAKHLLNMTNRYWDTWRFKGMYSIRHNSVSHKSWNETGSSIRVATARNEDAGRSQTIQFLHGSEVAFWDNAVELMTGLSQSIPDTSPSIIALESTANGIGGYFYEQWNKAVDGETEYVPLFFPWHEHPQYTARYLGLSSVLGKMDDEERILSAIGIDDDRLAWRRWCIANKCNGDLNQFHQEMPSTPEEAFVVTGTNIFPDGELAACYDPQNGVRGFLVEERGRVRFQESIEGPVTIFRWPGDDKDACKYMISGDATRSVQGDFSCAQVVNRRTWEQVAVYHARINPVGFGDQMAMLGRYYNWAILAPEIQGAGDSTISRLISLNYPFLFEHRNAEKIQGMPLASFGWWSGVRAKQESIGNLLKSVVDRDITIHHHQTYAEMRAYVSDGKGGFKNGANEKHDDTVTAMAIAITAVMYEAANINASLGVYGGDAAGRMEGLGGAVSKTLRDQGSGLGMGGDPRSAEVPVDDARLPWDSWGAGGGQGDDGEGGMG